MAYPASSVGVQEIRIEPITPLIENAVLIGDGRPYIVVLLAPSLEGVAAWAGETGEDRDIEKHLAVPGSQKYE